MHRNSLPEAERRERLRVGTILRTVRKARDISPDKLACDLGISRPYIANIEAGRKPLTPALAAMAAVLLEVDPIVFERSTSGDKAA
jgi:transcriptional regulator with XRE-family HTH domain